MNLYSTYSMCVCLRKRKVITEQQLNAMWQQVRVISHRDYSLQHKSRRDFLFVLFKYKAGVAFFSMKYTFT